MLSRLPSVDRVVESGPARALLELYARARVVEAVRRELDRLRGDLLSGRSLPEADLSPEAICRCSAQWLAELGRVRLLPVVNATGILVHTNLGRAELAESAAHAAGTAALSACTLEYDL